MSCTCGEKRVYSSEKAPRAVGPYSPAIKASNMIFVSGQIGVVPATGDLAAGGFEAEARQALDNLKVTVEAAGADLTMVVKTTVFLRDIADYAKMNAIYAEYFTVNPPARSAFQVGALPKAAAIEIEAIAMIPECCCGCDCNCGCGCDCDCDCDDDDKECGCKE